MVGIWRLGRPSFRLRVLRAASVSSLTAMRVIRLRGGAGAVAFEREEILQV